MKRGKMELVGDTIEAIRITSKISHIMYRTNTVSHILYPIMDVVLRNGLVRAEQEGRYRRYYLTDKGLVFLKCYEDLKVLLRFE